MRGRCPPGLGCGHWLEGLHDAMSAAEQVHGAESSALPRAAGLRLAPQKAQLSFAHTGQPRDRWERKGSLRSHILGNCQRRQLRFSKPLQCEPAAGSLTRQPGRPSFSRPFGLGSLPNCAPRHPAHLLGSPSAGLAEGGREDPFPTTAREQGRVSRAWMCP